MDSQPVPVCDNLRIRRCRLYPRKRHGEAFRGYVASKRRFFYDLWVHLVMTTSGLPVDVMLAPGAEADIAAPQKRFHTAIQHPGQPKSSKSFYSFGV